MSILERSENGEAREPMLISASAVAQLLQISTRTLWRQLSAGQIPKPVRIGGSVRWRLDEVRKWIAAGCPAQSSAIEQRELEG